MIESFDPEKEKVIWKGSARITNYPWWIMMGHISIWIFARLWIVMSQTEEWISPKFGLLSFRSLSRSDLPIALFSMHHDPLVDSNSSSTVCREPFEVGQSTFLVCVQGRSWVSKNMLILFVRMLQWEACSLVLGWPDETQSPQMTRTFSICVILNRDGQGLSNSSCGQSPWLRHSSWVLS
jgi:hypothetical protein